MRQKRASAGSGTFPVGFIDSHYTGCRERDTAIADILIDNQTSPTTPAAGKSVIWVDATTKKLVLTDDAGIRRGSPLSRNTATAAQGLLATTEVYLTNSNLLIPSYGLEAGQTYIWLVSVVKTAAGVAAPVWTFRIGAAGAVGDTSRLALTSTQAQTGVASDGILTAMLTVRNVGASGVVAGSGGSGGGPGFGGGGSGASSTFDNTGLGGQFIGLTVTTGASAAWTVNALSCWMLN